MEDGMYPMTKQNRKSKGGRQGREMKGKFAEEVRQPVQAKNGVQKEFLRALKQYDVVLFSAPAGVGKSFLTMSEASDWLKRGQIDKITLTRPVIPMGRSLGMLPSTLKEKFEPYLMPLLEVLWKRYGKSFYDNCLRNGTLELLAPEYARGRSVSGCMIIDECQSMYPSELYTMLTRMEDGAKLILIGDDSGHQTDIKGENAISWLKRFIKENPDLSEYICVIEATSDDIVRSGLTKAMVKAREKENKKGENSNE